MCDKERERERQYSELNAIARFNNEKWVIIFFLHSKFYLSLLFFFHSILLTFLCVFVCSSNKFLPSFIKCILLLNQMFKLKLQAKQHKRHIFDMHRNSNTYCTQCIDEQTHTSANHTNKHWHSVFCAHCSLCIANVLIFIHSSTEMWKFSVSNDNFEILFRVT